MIIENLEEKKNDKFEEQRKNLEAKFNVPSANFPEGRSYILLKGKSINSNKADGDYWQWDWFPIFVDLGIDWKLILNQKIMDDKMIVVGGNFVLSHPEAKKAKQAVQGYLNQRQEVEPSAVEVKTEEKIEEVKKRLKAKKDE